MNEITADLPKVKLANAAYLSRLPAEVNWGGSGDLASYYNLLKLPESWKGASSFWVSQNRRMESR